MGKKFLFLEVVARPGKPPIVYVWTHHGDGLLGEWRGSILEPRKRSVIRWLSNLFISHYYKHTRAYTRARMRGEKAVKGYGLQEEIRRTVALTVALTKEGRDERSRTDDD